MKLWVETDAVNSAGKQVRMKVQEVTADIDRQVKSRGVRVANALRNAELRVLRGQRSGKRYRKYPYKSMYTASAPGEPPARRSGNLRLHWSADVIKGSSSGNGSEIIAFIESGEDYADILEKGSEDGRIAARPFVDRIKEEANPEVQRICSEPYT